MNDFENTALWKKFKEKAEPEQYVMVENLVNKAASRLDLVRDTFPTYTLHNRIHSLNVVNLIGNLLGSSLENITALEGAVLILSAYCHDIGMVFSEDERQNIRNEDEFAKFVKEHPEAALQISGEQEIPIDVAEWYCRWIHPDRVFNFLRQLNDDEIRWGQTSIHNRLGDVCRSHGYDVGELLDDTKFPTDFRNEADLRFCAIMLRLGDILDFDNSRSPEEVYKYLGVAKRQGRREATSDVEWLKHLNTEGFSFPKEKTNGNYKLKVLANPDHPAVEFDVRQFLDVIENEFQKCSGVLTHCSDKWRNFILPTEIDRKDISSKGYKYGEYRFTLEQKRTLELLMGENLYDDPFTFIRELVQNAIDTSRHRIYFEKSKGNADFVPKPITLSTWMDEDSYQWVRIDDYGMGMTEEIINKYFLKVGESYYRSAQFQADVLNYQKKAQQKFVPISRFGIGVLSCFIAGDRVDLTTRHIGDGKSDPYSIRLSLSGLHSFYILQSDRDKHYDAKSMPAPRQEEEQQKSYRRGDNYGTSITIRLDPQKENTRFNLKEILERHVFCSPVPVIFEGEAIGGDTQALINQPWTEDVIEEELTDEEMKEIERVFGFQLSRKVRLRLIPLDLTKYSPTPNLKGQALLFYLLLTEEDKKRYSLSNYHGEARKTVRLYHKEDETLSVQIFIQASYRNESREKRLELEREQIKDKLYSHEELYLRREYNTFDSPKHLDSKGEEAELKQRLYEIDKETAEINRKCDINISRVLEKLSPQIKDYIKDTLANNSKWLSHNGIIVPIKIKKGYSGKNHFDFITGNDFFITKVLALSDELRPDISLSRDQLKSLSWNIYSAIELAFWKGMEPYKKEDLPIIKSWIQSSSDKDDCFQLGNILNDPFIKVDGEWSAQDIIQTDKGQMSLHNILAELSGGGSFQLTNLLNIDSLIKNEYGVSFSQVCSSALIQIGLSARLKEVSHYTTHLIVDSVDTPILREGQKLFPPLFFVPYENSNLLRQYDSPLNQNHPFSEWLIENAVAINEKYPGIFNFIKKNISIGRYDFKDKIVDELNEMLDRLWGLDLKIRPEKKLQLKDEDFKMRY